MNAAGFGSAQQTVLPSEIVTAVEDCGFFESIPLWAVTLIGGLFITVLSFILIMLAYGRFFKLCLYTAIASVPLSTFAGSPSQSVGMQFSSVLFPEKRTHLLRRQLAPQQSPLLMTVQVQSLDCLKCFYFSKIPLENI